MKVLPATEENIEKAAAIIKKGGVVVYPTETVYGIGCAPYNAEAAERVCYVKGRADKPLPLACADADDARGIVEFNPAAERLAERFWPGPLMLVLPARIEYSVWVTHGAKTLGVRVPDHDVARRLAELSDGIIVSTSANRTGEPPATTAEEAAERRGGPDPQRRPRKVSAPLHSPGPQRGAALDPQSGPHNGGADQERPEGLEPPALGDQLRDIPLQGSSDGLSHRLALRP
jgi:L-threonylcarbamoyladenylate synthase